MSFGRYLLGYAALACTLGALALSASLVRARVLPSWRGAQARLAEAVIGLSLLTGVLELLGLVGLLSFAPIVVACVLVGAVSVWKLRARRPPGLRTRLPAENPLARAVAAAIVGVVFAEWAVPAFHSYDVGIQAFDSLWYHLPWAATFAHSGQITPLHFTDVEYLTAFYPATAELLHGSGIVLFGSDLLSPGINLAFAGLALLAAWCIGAPRGLGALTLTGAALALAVPMMRFSQAGSAANDILGVFFLLAAAALIASDTGATGRAAWLLAAVSTGLAVSVKLSLLAPALALTIGAFVIARPERRRALAAPWIGALVLAGGFWYARNLIAVGNPLPWVNVGVFATPAQPLQAHTAFAVIHYLFDGHAWSRYLRPGLADGLGRVWPIVLLAAILGPLVCIARGADRTARLLGAVAIASWIGYLLTPEGAAGPAGRPLGFAFNLRYAAPALSLSLAVLPLAAQRCGAAVRHATLGALALVLVLTLTQARLWPSGYSGSGVLIGLLVAVAAAVLLFGELAASPAFAAGAICAVLAAGAPLGYAAERHYLHGRYVYEPGVSSLATLWQWFRGVHHARVGLVGTFGGFFSYPLFGLDDSNRVQYVGERGAHGSFSSIRTCAAWRRAVDRGRYRYVVTTPGRDPWRPRRLFGSPEGMWTASDPAALKVFSSRAVGQEVAVYELRGALDPAACPASSS